MSNLCDHAVREELSNIPPIDNCVFELVLRADQKDDPRADAYVTSVDPSGSRRVVAFIDGDEGAAYRCGEMPIDENATPVALGKEPLVKTVGDFSGETGQIVIKQPEGHWRRYSRWDRIRKAPPTQPDAVVRTLPQCGCGGYLGAPMMFDSFKEMLAYFFVVFSDAESVNAKHAAILGGGACEIQS